MSHETTAGHHPHTDDGAVHAHISSTPFYVAGFPAPLALTVLTVGQSYIDLGRLNLIVVILIATTKASLVVSFFMHLRYDNKFNALIFVSCIFFIGVFFAYTMNDTEHRGELDGDQNVRVLPKTGEAAPGGFTPPAAAEHGAAAGGEHGAAPTGASAPTGAAPAHH